MSNEIKTIFGAIGVAATGIAAGLTFGQIKELNDAVESTAKYTADKASKTIVRHVGETAINAAETAGTAVLAGVCLGQVDSLNNAVVESVKSTAKAAEKTADVVVKDVNALANSTPIVGHIKGGIHYACGENEEGDIAMKSASRTAAVAVGGAIGVVGGPAGVVAGSLVAGGIMDATTTVVESVIKDEYTPSGTIASLERIVKAVEANDDQEAIEGFVDVFATVSADVAVGRVAGKIAKTGGRGMNAIKTRDISLITDIRDISEIKSFRPDPGFDNGSSTVTPDSSLNSLSYLLDRRG